MHNPADLPSHHEVSVEASRFIRAPRAVVFDAWIKPHLRKQWWACGPCDICHIHARVGGTFKIGTNDRGDGQAFIAIGEFQIIDPPTRLEYTWTWLKPADFVEDSLVSVRFEEAEGGTNVFVTHSRFVTEDHASPHKNGWEDGLEALATLVEANV